MLGTNDAKTFQWNEEQYIEDYLEMYLTTDTKNISLCFPVDFVLLSVPRAKTFLSMASSPHLYVIIPPPLYQDNNVYSMSQTVHYVFTLAFFFLAFDFILCTRENFDPVGN